MAAPVVADTKKAERPPAYKEPAEKKNPEKYSEDDLPEFTPMPWYASLSNTRTRSPDHRYFVFRTLGEIRAAIPPRLFVRQTWKGMLYLTRDFVLAAAFWWAALRIDPFFKSAEVVSKLTPVGAEVARWSMWAT